MEMPSFQRWAKSGSIGTPNGIISCFAPQQNMSGYRERISKNLHFGREAHPVMRPDFKSENKRLP